MVINFNLTQTMDKKLMLIIKNNFLSMIGFSYD